MYLQTINDVTNTLTGKADGQPWPTHTENGMFLHVPSTTNDPNNVAVTIRRLGSIPHGVAINLRGFEPNASATVAGPPNITPNPGSTTPFKIVGTNVEPEPKPDSLAAANDTTARIPQNLDLFVQQGTITDTILDDPTALLRKVNQTRNIISTMTLTISSTNLIDPLKKPTDIPTGGGVVGNAFLDGDVGKPNAFPFSVDFTLWIETVAYQVPVPKFRPVKGGGPVEVVHEGIKFVLQPPREISEPTTVAVEVIELQYFQMVLLQFGVPTWPHPTVSTLKPEAVSVGEDHEGWKAL